MLPKLKSLLRDLVAIDSVSPTLESGPGEEEIARWVKRWLDEHNIPCTVQGVAPGRPNLIAHVKGRGEGLPLVINAHLDTVGVAGMSAPFEMREEGDRLYGRGTYDMKAGVATMMLLAEHFLAEPPPGDLWLTWVSDEEDLSIGTEALMRHWLPTLSEWPAAAIVVEPTEEQIAIAHKGFAWFRLDVTGKAGHGSRPEEAIDAIVPLGAALQEIVAMEQAFIEGPRHPLLGRPSLHASMIEGGSAWSVYPASATLRWERRTLPDEEEGVLEAELARVIDAARAVNGATVGGRHLFSRYPLGTAADEPIVRALQQAAPNAALVGVSFWTDGALFSEAGLPTVIYGVIGHGAHAVDEWVSAASMERTYHVLRDLVARGLPG